MAIDVNNSRFCLYAAQQGVSFRRTLMLGRLGLFVPPSLLQSFFKEFGLSPRGDPAFFTAPGHDFSEEFFRQLGAEEVSAIDFSDYEGADHVHDLNRPVPSGFHERFDTVIDGGTMEHVFNFPVALFNAMFMVRVGGHLLLDLPANNCCGHGFYQFSPELFFRIFQPEYGFAVEKVWIAEDLPFSPFHEVRDPAEIHARVMLVNREPAHLFVQARRVGEIKPLDTLLRYPAQADYTQYWATNTSPTQKQADAPSSGWREHARRLARDFFPRWYWRFSVQRNARRDQTRARLDNLELYRDTKPPGSA